MAYLLHAFAGLVDGLQPWREVSPFTWYAGATTTTYAAGLSISPTEGPRH